ncbi:proopiomelanocortin [Sesbania bispinosa]|nr:proopiomelanocortin [Sesbania bispinosa]
MSPMQEILKEGMETGLEEEEVDLDNENSTTTNRRRFAPSVERRNTIETFTQSSEGSCSKALEKSNMTQRTHSPLNSTWSTHGIT